MLKEVIARTRSTDSSWLAESLCRRSDVRLGLFLEQKFLIGGQQSAQQRVVRLDVSRSQHMKDFLKK